VDFPWQATEIDLVKCQNPWKCLGNLSHFHNVFDHLQLIPSGLVLGLKEFFQLLIHPALPLVEDLRKRRKKGEGFGGGDTLAFGEKVTV
jgi:hypothetical protein